MSDANKNEIAREFEQGTIEGEARFHHYLGNDIPWYVRAMWLGFWILAVTYTIQWLFPAMQVELFHKQ